MSVLDVTRNYLDGEVLFASDIDDIIDDIEYFLNTTKLTDENISDGGITGSLKLVNASVTNAKMASNSIGTSNIIADAVTNAKLADNAVTTAKIIDGAVTVGKLASNSIDSSNIVNGAVTRVKLAAPNYTLSSSHSGAFATVSTSAVAVTNLSATLVKTGRPVLICTLPNTVGAGNPSLSLSATGTAGSAFEATFYLYKDGSVHSAAYFPYTPAASGATSISIGPSSLVFIDTSGSTGSSVYALYASVGGVGSPAANVLYCSLLAIEL